MPHPSCSSPPAAPAASASPPQERSARGFTVIASARKAEDVALLRQQGLLAVQLDLADSASIERGRQRRWPWPRAPLRLFNNGAYGQPGALEDLPTGALREQFRPTSLAGITSFARYCPPCWRQARAHSAVTARSLAWWP